MTTKDDSTVSRLLAMGLARQGAVRRREDIEIAMEESMMEIIPQLEKRTAYVALGASIATLLGLLGTIIGLIQAFTAVANANPGGEGRPAVRQHLGRDEHDGVRADRRDPAAGDALRAHRQDGQIVDSLEMASVKALNVITAQAKRQIAA
jgi:biopolymer transport protein ExbB